MAAHAVQQKRIVNHKTGMRLASKDGNLTMNEPALGMI